MEEEELKEIMNQQEKYKNLFENNNKRVRQLEEDEKNRLEEHKRQKIIKN